MQYKPGNWVTGFKRSPRAANVQHRDMGLFLNSSGKFEPIDDSWDNLHSGGLFISDDNKLYFRDETNKDIYINSPVDNQITIGATSGVGINTTPAETLHVVDTTSEGGVLIDNTATDGNPILAFGLSGTKTFTMGVDDGDSDKFKIFSGAAIDGTSEFVIDGSGNVGIGATAPTGVQLQVHSATTANIYLSSDGNTNDSDAQTTLWFVHDYDGTKDWAGITFDGDDILRINNSGTSNDSHLVINDSGNVGIGATPGTLLELNSTAPYLTLRNSTHEDGDGGRESKIIFEGEQSGGEDSTLAVIQASHDGASDDEKGDLIFSTNDGSDGAAPTERLRIDSAGQLGIGDASLGKTSDYSYANDLLINSVNANNFGGITIKGADGTDVNGIRFAIATGSGGDTYKGFVQYSHVNNSMELGANSLARLKIDSSGNVEVDAGNLVIGTAGQGIDFSNQASPAAGMTSELLDRYEEGTFTATIADAASGGNEGSTVTATYTRIGRLCHFRIGYVNLSTSGLTSGNDFYITGFPFTATGGNGNMTPVIASYLSTPSTIQGYVVSGTTYAQVVAQSSTGAWPYVKVSGFTSGSADLYMNGSFEVAT